MRLPFPVSSSSIRGNRVSCPHPTRLTASSGRDTPKKLTAVSAKRLSVFIFIPHLIQLDERGRLSKMNTFHMAMNSSYEFESDLVAALYQLSVDGSYSKASRSLHLTQPALSKKILRLEKSLGVTLVIRGSKGVSLTEAGLDAIRYYRIKRTLDQELMQSILSFNSGLKLGEVRLATYSSIARSAILPCLKELLHNASHVHVDLMSRELEELPALLLSGQADFIVTTSPIQRQNLMMEHIADEEFVHVRPIGGAIDLPFLDHDARDQTTIQFLEKQGLSGATSRNFYDDIYMILDAVANGFGQAIVSKHLIDTRQDIEIVPHKKRMIQKVFLQYHRNAYQPKFQERIIHLIKKNLAGFLLATFALLFTSAEAHAWGDLGHRAVGEIAERNLSEKAKALVFKILGAEPLSTASTFADSVRPARGFDFLAKYHYINLPFEKSIEAGVKAAQKEPTADAFLRNPQLLNDPKLSRESKMLLLRYLVHIVGDIHQPLHIGNGVDAGASKCWVKWKDRAAEKTTIESLHYVWDERLPQVFCSDFDAKHTNPLDRPWCTYKEFVDSLMSELDSDPQRKQTLVSQGKILERLKWYEEGRALHPSVYPDEKPTSPFQRPYCQTGAFQETKIPLLDEKYVRRAYSIAKNQILKAGFRLAGMINQVAEAAKTAPLAKDTEAGVFEKLHLEKTAR